MISFISILTYNIYAYALKIVLQNEWVNESNFEKLPYAGFQDQAGVSRVLRQSNISLKNLYCKFHNFT